MDYENKYNEALKAMESLYNVVRYQSSSDALLTSQTIEKAFPELHESEDERIRKGLIKGLSAMKNIHNRQTFSDDAINIDDAIAWLEKQGERDIDCFQNHQDSGHPNGCIVLEDFNGGEGFYKLHLDYLNKKQVEDVEELVRTWNTESNSPNNENIRACIGMCLTDADEQRFKNYNTSLKDCLIWLEKQSETENENDADFTIYHPLKNYCNGKYECIPYSFFGSLTSFSKSEDLIDFLRNCFYTEKECEEWIKKQDEQKEIDYDEGEEDIDMIQDAIHWINEFQKSNRCKDENDMQNSVTCENWLKSLQDRVQLQPKQEWSEEDEKMYQSIVDDTVQENQLDSNQLVWLKSLKYRVQPQPKQEWSEEDSWMLNVCCNAIDSYKEPVDKYLVKKWLKSLKPQTKQVWNEEDGKTIDEAISLINMLASGYGEKVTEPITFNGVEMINNLKERLRNLHQKPNHWKPSEQNIKDLEWCADLVKDKMGVGFHRLQVFIDELKNF